MPKVLRALVTSDWHLGGLKRHFPYDHIARQFHEIDKIYQYAIDKGIEHVFVPGDISDTPSMDDETYIALISHLQKYDGHINTYYIAGNHDFSDTKKTSLDLLNTLSSDRFQLFKSFHLFLQPKQLEIDGVVVNMTPHPAEETIENDLPCLNFVHVSYDGAIGDNGRVLKVKNEMDSDVRDFTISGHIHQHQFMKNKRVLYCGNPFQKNFGEKLPKGFVEIIAKYNDEDELLVKHRFIDNKPNFRLETRLIETQKDISELEINPSIRYRLYVDPEVTLPSDLRTRIPNVAQILDSKGKKLDTLEDAEAFVQDAVDVPKVDPLFGLKEAFKSNGYSAREYKMGRAIVQDILDELGHVM